MPPRNGSYRPIVIEGCESSHLFKRNNSNKWQLYAMIDGIEIKKSTYTDNLKAATIKAGDIVRSAIQGVPVTSDINRKNRGQTIADVLAMNFGSGNELVSIYQMCGWQNRTLKENKRNLEQFAHHFERKALASITDKDAMAYMAIIRTRTSDATHNRHRVSLNKFFEKCIILQLVAKNPMSNVATLKENKKLPVPLTQQQVEQARELYSEHGRIITDVYYLTGMRRSELHGNEDKTGVRWMDVDRANNIILLMNTKGLVDRHVPLTPPLLAILNSVRTGRDFLMNNRDRKLSDNQIKEVRIQWHKGLRQQKTSSRRNRDPRNGYAVRLAKEYGVSDTLIRKIVEGHNYDEPKKSRYTYVPKKVYSIPPETLKDAVIFPKIDLKSEYKRIKEALGIQSMGSHKYRKTWATILNTRGATDADLRDLGGWKDSKTIDLYRAANPIRLNEIAQRIVGD